MRTMTRRAQTPTTRPEPISAAFLRAVNPEGFRVYLVTLRALSQQDRLFLRALQESRAGRIRFKRGPCRHDRVFEVLGYPKPKP